MPLTKALPPAARATEGQETKNKIIDLTYASLSKACFAVVGFCFKEALLRTWTGTSVQNDANSLKGLDHEWADMFSPVVTYLLLVATAVLIRMSLGRRALSLTKSQARIATFKTLAAGADLIPAWAFKDCVAVVLAGRQPVLCAVLVLLGAMIFACCVEPTPQSEDDASGDAWQAVYEARKTLAGCMGLGVGFAMHVIPQTLWRGVGYRWFQLSFLAVYVPAITAVTVCISMAVWSLGTNHSHYFLTMVALPKSGLNFCTAFAWDDLFHMLRGLITAHGAHCGEIALLMLVWACFVLTLGVMTNVLKIFFGWGANQSGDQTSSSSSRGEQIRIDTRQLLITVSAMCTCWAFLDVFVGIYHCFGGPLESYPYLGAWVFAVAVLLLITVCMFFLTYSVEELKVQGSRPRLC